MAHTVTHDDVVIADAATDSGQVDLLGYQLAGIVIPAEWEGIALKFKAAAQARDGGAGTFFPVHDKAGTEVSFTVAASRFVHVDPELLAGARFVKLVAGTAQTGAVTLQVMKRREI